MTETALAKLDTAKRVLAEARDLTVVLKIRDMALAAEIWAKTARGGEENARIATEIKLRAERRAGEILRENPELQNFKPIRGNMKSPLTQMRIAKQESSRWQRIAKIPEAKFESYIANAQRLQQGTLLHAASRLSVTPLRPLEPPQGKFNVIYADPPWPSKIPIAADVQRQYETKTVEDIGRQEIPSADNAVLFLWTINILLKEAIWVLEQWGFQYRTNMVWVKDRFGAGFYFRGQHELLLLGKKGNMPTPLEADRPSSVLQAPRGTHSEKPQAVYDLIERMYPNCRYLEMFARTRRKGWESWGLEVPAV